MQAKTDCPPPHPGRAEQSPRARRRRACAAPGWVVGGREEENACARAKTSLDAEDKELRIGPLGCNRVLYPAAHVQRA